MSSASYTGYVTTFVGLLLSCLGAPGGVGRLIWVRYFNLALEQGGGGQRGVPATRISGSWWEG